MKPSKLAIHPDARARMQMLSEMHERLANKHQTHQSRFAAPGSSDFKSGSQFSGKCCRNSNLTCDLSVVGPAGR